MQGDDDAGPVVTASSLPQSLKYEYTKAELENDQGVYSHIPRYLSDAHDNVPRDMNDTRPLPIRIQPRSYSEYLSWRDLTCGEDAPWTVAMADNFEHGNDYSDPRVRADHKPGIMRRGIAPSVGHRGTQDKKMPKGHLPTVLYHQVYNVY